MYLFWCLRSSSMAIIFPAITGIFSVYSLLVMAPFYSLAKKNRAIKRWASLLVWLSGTRVEVEGLENLNGEDPKVLVSNHQSLFDIPILLANIPVPLRMAAKAELFRIPIFGRALLAAGFVPIKRERPGAQVSAFARARKNFEQGLSIWFAPEGTRFDGDGLGPFKMGAFFLAQNEGRRLVPLLLEGTKAVLPKHSITPNWGKRHGEVKITIFKPIDTAKLTRDQLRDQAREVLNDALTRKNKI